MTTVPSTSSAPHQEGFGPVPKVQVPSLSHDKTSATPAAKTHQLGSLAAILAEIMGLFTAITQQSMENWAKVTNSMSEGLINLNTKQQTVLQGDSDKVSGDVTNNASADQLAKDQMAFSMDQSCFNIVTQQSQTNEQNASGTVNDLGSSSSTETTASQAFTSVGSNLNQLLAH